MSNDVLIKVENVSKKYCRYLKDSMVYGAADIGRNMLGLSSHSEQLRPNEFWSVSDVSFEVKRGETLGLVGANGCGKTTMLKMINGIFWPDQGKITIKGRIGALIAVGAGFHPLLTGRENIYINGAILGMSKKEVDQKFDSIVDFSGVEEFLDSPVKHYSSGMYVRLGFAIAVHSHCDILLIDEVLAVGDVKFQSKCLEKIKELGKQGVTKIFVSHSFEAVQTLCKNSLYLVQGKMRSYGATHDVLDQFKKDVAGGLVEGADCLRYGTKDVEITKVEILDAAGLQKTAFKRGERFRVRMSFFAKSSIHNPSFTVLVHDENGQLLHVTDSGVRKYKTGDVKGEGVITYTFEALPLHKGKYWLSTGCWQEGGNIAFDHHERMYPFIIEPGGDMPEEWEIQTK